jgi:hypothetical protein
VVTKPCSILAREISGDKRGVAYPGGRDVGRGWNRVLKTSSSYRNPMVKHEPELHITTRRHRCCTLLLYSRLSQFLRVAKVPLTDMT